MTLELLKPNKPEGYHKLHGVSVENKRIEIGKGPFLDFLTDCTLKNCTIRIHGGANTINFLGSTFQNCTFWPAKQLNNARFRGLNLIGCTFLGHYVGCRFGNEGPLDSSLVRECDFSQAKSFHLCDFLDGSEPETCKFPNWPHILITDLPASREDWLSLDLPDELRITQEVIGEAESISEAVSVYLPAELDDFEALRPLFASRSYIRMEK